MPAYLIVANLTLGGDALWSEVRDRLASGPCRFHVIVPASHDPMAGTWTEQQARAEASERLERALVKLRGLGAEATGEVGDIRAVDALLDALDERRYDEVIVSTLPPHASKWLRMDLVSRMRRATDVPITHVVGQHEPVR
jgi:hypothetical protein